MARFDLVVIGDATPDLLVRGGDVVPAFEQREQMVEEARLMIGGSGAIMACGAARLGLRTAFVGLVGDDPFGRFMLDSLRGRDVDVSSSRVDPERPTGVTVVLWRGEDRAMLTALGTIAALGGSLVDADVLADARHVHLSSYYLQEGLQPDLPALFDNAHRAGATTSIDPNWDPYERWDAGLLELLWLTDYFMPNSAEARAITGIDDIDVATESLSERGTTLAVKFGQGGGLVKSGDELVHVEAVPVDVVDTTGAGDSFDAGFLAGCLRGWPIRRCLQLAVACGSLSARAAGGITAQPTMDEAIEAIEALEAT
jgi:sugar/nucleoside kinase (ribokinase family)